MGRKKKKGDEENKKKKNSGPNGCGARAHLASEWGGGKSLKNAVLNNGYIEGFVLACSAEDAGLRGLSAFHQLETMHCAGSRLVEHGRELTNGNRQGIQHHRTEMVWDKGPSAWMTKAKQVLINKFVDQPEDLEKLLIRIGERYDGFAQSPGGDISAAYRLMEAVAKKLDELKLAGSAALEKLETEAMDGKRPWLFQSMEAADKRRQASDAKRQADEAAKKAADKAAEERARAGK